MARVGPQLHRKKKKVGMDRGLGLLEVEVLQDRRTFSRAYPNCL